MQFIDAEIRYPGFPYRAFGIPGRADKTQSDHRLITFVRVEHRVGKLGGLAKADWQQTSGQRVERSGMSRLNSTEQAPYTLQSGVGSQSGRLIEEQDAMNHGTRLPTVYSDLTKAVSLGLCQASPMAVGPQLHRSAWTSARHARPIHRGQNGVRE